MIRRLVLSFTVLFIAVAPASPLFAVDVTSDACKDITTSAVCADAQAGKSTNPLFGADGILTTATRLLSFVVGIIAVIVLIVAGIRFAINGGNPQEITKARNTIIYACVGIILAVLSQAIVIFILEKL